MQGRISFVGSDTHCLKHQPPSIASGIAFIKDICDTSYADAILDNNTKTILLGGIMEVFIMPNKRFIQEVRKVKTSDIAAILCSSYDLDTASVSGVKKKLILNFDDIVSAGNNSFNFSIAREIKNFVDTLTSEILYVCCDSGESRSSAIAAAILKYKGEKNLHIWDNPHYHPNTLVYETMCKCFGKNTPKIVIRYLKRRNDNALRKAIRR